MLFLFLFSSPARRFNSGRLCVLEKLVFLFLVSLCVADDGAIMSKLNATISGISWSGSDYCNWYGIECDYSRRVTEIQLAFKSLSGTLPAELNQFTHLRTLSLEANSFSGELPYLSNLTSLDEVYLHANNFTSIPPGFFIGFNNLKTFTIDDNIDLAPWSIPADFSCRSLVYFTAMQSSLTGPIPDIFDSFPQLEYLDLSDNNLTGPLPKSLSSSRIEYLFLRGAGLSGTIEALSSMTQLTQVWLHINAFTGPIPDLSSCHHLFDLQLRDNQFTGVVHSSLMYLPELLNVSLQNNKLQGPYPDFNASITATLTPGNSFCLNTPGPCDPQVTALISVAGSIGYPSILANSWANNDACNGWSFVACDSLGKYVTIVNFSRQNFSGTISSAFADLTWLKSLNLNDNGFTGTIPQSLTNLTQLQVIDVSNNNLSGLVPVFRPGVTFKSSGNFFLDDGGSMGTSGSGSSGLTPTGNSTEASNNGGSGSVSQGMVVGIIASVIIFVGIVLVVSHKYCHLKRRHQRFRGIEDPENGEMVIPSSMVARCTLRRRWVGVGQLELQAV